MEEKYLLTYTLKSDYSTEIEWFDNEEELLTRITELKDNTDYIDAIKIRVLKEYDVQ